MIRRKLTTIGNSKVLTMEPFLLEYLGLEDSDDIILKIENESLVVFSAASISSSEYQQMTSASTAPSIQSVSEKSHYIRDFFKDGRLSIGDELIYYPAIEEGKATINDSRIKAKIIRDANGNRYYLESEADGKEYSLSGLRRKIIVDLGLVTVKRDWVFEINSEWKLLKTNRYLSEL